MGHSFWDGGSTIVQNIMLARESKKEDRGKL
jgi:hypothetical protein